MAVNRVKWGPYCAEKGFKLQAWRQQREPELCRH